MKTFVLALAIAGFTAGAAAAGCGGYKSHKAEKPIEKPVQAPTT